MKVYRKAGELSEQRAFSIQPSALDVEPRRLATCQMLSANCQVPWLNAECCIRYPSVPDAATAIGSVAAAEAGAARSIWLCDGRPMATVEIACLKINCS